MPRRRKVFLSSFGACSFRVVFFFGAHVHLALTELKSLLLKKDELVTDLTNIMYRQTDAVEKLSKVQADSDKRMVKNMKQIKDLVVDHDQKAQQLADLEAAAQVFIGMVKEEGAGSKSLLERLCNTRFTKGHKPSNHIRARIKSHVYTTE